MSKHKHAEVIKAWADGATVEVFSTDDGAWVTLNAPFYWNERHEYRVKPEKIYPVTQMSDKELDGTYNPADDYMVKIRAIANGSLRHAIDAGQVITLDEHVQAMQVEMTERNAARDMAIAEAVRRSCAGIVDDEYLAIKHMDLAAIIAHVNP